MSEEELKINLRKDIKTLRDISKTIKGHGFYTSIPSVLESIANDISEYLETTKVMIDGETPAVVLTNKVLNGRESVLSRIEKMQI